MNYNGQLTNTTPIYGGHRLRADATTSWVRLCNYFGREIKLTDSYRPLTVQRNIFFSRYISQATGGGYYGDVKHYNGVRYVRLRGYATVAVPGTSNHGWGTAVDIADGVNKSQGEVWNWLNTYAHMFGWFNPAWAKTKNYYEPWHWEYNPAKDTKRNEPLSGAVSDRLNLSNNNTGNESNTSNTVKEWDEMASREELKQVFQEVLGQTDIAGAVWTRDFGGQGKPEDIAWWILKNLQNSLATLSAQNKAILTNLEKNGVDPAIIAKSVKEALADIEITLKAGN